jgi:hypothetical protein
MSGTMTAGLSNLRLRHAHQGDHGRQLFPIVTPV